MKLNEQLNYEFHEWEYEPDYDYFYERVYTDYDRKEAIDDINEMLKLMDTDSEDGIELYVRVGKDKIAELFTGYPYLTFKDECKSILGDCNFKIQKSDGTFMTGEEIVQRIEELYAELLRKLKEKEEEHFRNRVNDVFGRLYEYVLSSGGKLVFTLNDRPAVLVVTESSEGFVAYLLCQFKNENREYVDKQYVKVSDNPVFAIWDVLSEMIADKEVSIAGLFYVQVGKYKCKLGNSEFYVPEISVWLRVQDKQRSFHVKFDTVEELVEAFGRFLCFAYGLIECEEFAGWLSKKEKKRKSEKTILERIQDVCEVASGTC